LLTKSSNSGHSYVCQRSSACGRSAVKAGAVHPIRAVSWTDSLVVLSLVRLSLRGANGPELALVTALQGPTAIARMFPSEGPLRGKQSNCLAETDCVALPDLFSSDTMSGLPRKSAYSAEVTCAHQLCLDVESLLAIAIASPPQSVALAFKRLCESPSMSSPSHWRSMKPLMSLRRSVV
jgi:hypothetical protein